jgi:hypothetical protein
MRLYRRTQMANTILIDGLEDWNHAFRFNIRHTGVWVSDRPLEADEGPRGDAVLVFEIPESAIREFEWARDGADHREWLLPAALLNRFGVYDVMRN